MLELIIAALAGGGIASLITAWAIRRKISAEAGEIEERIRKSVIESLQGHIDFLNNQVERMQARITALEKENELLRKKLEQYRNEHSSDTGLHEVVA